MKKEFFLVLLVLLNFPASVFAQNNPFLSWWDYCYVGGHIGYNDGTTNNLSNIRVGRRNIQGETWGGLFGCDHKFAQQFLIGLQGDFSLANAYDGARFTTGQVFNTNFETKLNAFGSITGRVGYVTGHWILYGKGGLAWSTSRLHNFSQFAQLRTDHDGTPILIGWTVSAGLEYRLTPKWSIFGEYSFYDFGRASVTLSGMPIASTFLIDQNFFHTKAGLIYRFDWSK